MFYFPRYTFRKELDSLQQAMNQLFQESTIRGYAHSYDFPQINIQSNDQNQVFVQAPLPGCDPNTLDITVEKNMLTLSGERKSDAPEKGNAIRSERSFGKFSRTLELPYRVDPNSIEASYKQGILEIKATQAEDDRPRKITIN